MKIKIAQRLTYANVASTAAILALVAGTGGVAYAAGVAKNSVGSPQIIDGSVLNKDIAPAVRESYTAGPRAYFDTLETKMITSEQVDKTVFEMTIPSGDYSVSFSSVIVNGSGTVKTFRCTLTQPIGEFTKTIGKTVLSIGNGDAETVVLNGVAVEAVGATVLTLTCDSPEMTYGGFVNDAQISAIALGSAVEK